MSGYRQQFLGVNPKGSLASDKEDIARDTSASVPMKLSLSDLDSHLVDFLGDRPISGGEFSDVYLGVHRPTQLNLAMKKLRRIDSLSGYHQAFRREVEAWSTLEHINILPFWGSMTIHQFHYLASPWMSLGNLFNFVQARLQYIRQAGQDVLSAILNHPTYQKFNKTTIIRDIAAGIKYLQSLEIVHGDIRAMNILMSDNVRAIVCDFGSAGVINDDRTMDSLRGFGATPWQSPEVLLGERKSFKSDIYSFGITIAEVLTGREPYPHLHGDGLTILAVTIRDERPLTQPPSRLGVDYEPLWNLAIQCWKMEPGERPAIPNILQELDMLDMIPPSLVSEDANAPSTPSASMSKGKNFLNAEHTYLFTSLPNANTDQLPAYASHMPLRLPSALSGAKPLEPGREEIGSYASGVLPAFEHSKRTSHIGPDLEEPLTTGSLGILPESSRLSSEQATQPPPSPFAPANEDLPLTKKPHPRPGPLLPSPLSSQGESLREPSSPLPLPPLQPHPRLSQPSPGVPSPDSDSPLSLPSLRLPPSLPFSSPVHSSPVTNSPQSLPELRPPPPVEFSPDVPSLPLSPLGSPSPVSTAPLPSPEPASPPVQAIAPYTQTDPASHPDSSQPVPRGTVILSRDSTPLSTWTDTSPVELASLSLIRSSISAEEFRLIEILDSPAAYGGFSDILIGVYKPTGTKLALKRPRLGDSDKVLRCTQREAKIWSILHHGNILPFLGTMVIGPYAYLASPWMENGTISRFVRGRLEYLNGEVNVTQDPKYDLYRLFDERQALREIAAGIAYLHGLGVVHGGLKGQDVLLDEGNRPLLCDFGLSKVLHLVDSVTSDDLAGVGTTRWMSPELFEGEPTTFESDVYAFAMIITEVITGSHPFPTISIETQVVHGVAMRNLRPSFEPLTRHGVDFVPLWTIAANCWQEKPQDRPRIEQVLEQLEGIPSRGKGKAREREAN